MNPNAGLVIVPLIALLFSGCMEDPGNPAEGVQGPLTEDAPFDDLLGAYESSDRNSWQKPGLILSRLAPLEGMTVADLGAGSGYFSFRLLPLATKVIAIEVDDRFIELLKERRSELTGSDRSRIEIRKGNEGDSGLKAQEADVILIVNTFIYLKARVDYLKHLKARLRPGGRILLVDFLDEPTRIGPPVEIRVPAEQAAAELELAGFQVMSLEMTALPYQYMIIAQ